MLRKRFVLITGMHRSRTSLLSSLMARASLQLSEKMVPATSSNPYGHFEDQEFVEWHERVLSDNHARWYRGISGNLSVSHARKYEAASLVERRFQELGPIWGFKVPHSSLFLDYWKSYKEARFIFIYRHPQEVISSLLRRMGCQLLWRPDAPFLFARAYVIYNQRIIKFVRENGTRSYVVESNDLVRGPNRVIADIAQKLDVPLKIRPDLGELIKSDIVSGRRHFIEARLSEYFSKLPVVRSAYYSMDAVCDSRALFSR